MTAAFRSECSSTSHDKNSVNNYIVGHKLSSLQAFSASNLHPMQFQVKYILILDDMLHSENDPTTGWKQGLCRPAFLQYIAIKLPLFAKLRYRRIHSCCNHVFKVSITIYELFMRTEILLSCTLFLNYSLHPSFYNCRAMRSEAFTIRGTFRHLRVTFSFLLTSIYRIDRV